MAIIDSAVTFSGRLVTLRPISRERFVDILDVQHSFEELTGVAVDGHQRGGTR